MNLNSTNGEVAMALQSDGKTVLVSTTQDYKFAAAPVRRDPVAAGGEPSGARRLDQHHVPSSAPLLGEVASGHALYFDANAAGRGWFVDPTLRDDSEFTTRGNQGEQHRMDLLMVLEHELGHLLGHDHAQSGVMTETLPAGMRRMPSSPFDLQETAALDWVFGCSDTKFAEW